MDNFESLKSKWNKSKREHESALSASAMSKMAVQSQKQSLRHHLGNVAILTTTVIVLILFFIYLAPVKEWLSRVGVVLMVGGLSVRVIIELISHRKASRMIYDEDLQKSAKQLEQFYAWRKVIHRPVTIIIFTLYSIGFYLITPEFLKYIDTHWVMIMDIGYVIIAIFLIMVIRNGNREEMKLLEKTRALQQQILTD